MVSSSETGSGASGPSLVRAFSSAILTFSWETVAESRDMLSELGCVFRIPVKIVNAIVELYRLSQQEKERITVGM